MTFHDVLTRNVWYEWITKMFYLLIVAYRRPGIHTITLTSRFSHNSLLLVKVRSYISCDKPWIHVTFDHQKLSFSCATPIWQHCQNPNLIIIFKHKLIASRIGRSNPANEPQFEPQCTPISITDSQPKVPSTRSLQPDSASIHSECLTQSITDTVISAVNVILLSRSTCG